MYLITSQRDALQTFGNPTFYSAAGTVQFNNELNELGLFTLYEYLGVANSAYVIRADVDLDQLVPNTATPTGPTVNGTYWLDTSETVWGIQEWNKVTSTFTVKTPLVITSGDDVTESVDPITSAPVFTPNDDIGSIGDYAIVSTSLTGDYHNVGWYKNSDNIWVVVGSQAWQDSWPTVYGSAAPASLPASANMYINDTLVTVPTSPDNTLSEFVDAINGASITGVTAGIVSGQLRLYGNSDATNDGSTASGGIISIETGPNNGAALLTALGILDREYLTPIYYPSYNQGAPRWRNSDTLNGRPTGSVWNNISPVNNGLSISLKKYSATLGDWVSQTVNCYFGIVQALYSLDPSGGGKNIPVGTVYSQANSWYWNTTPNDSLGFELFEKVAIGQTVVAGTTTPTGNA